MTTIDYNDFKDEILADNSLVMIFIKWSGTSQLMKPIVENIASKYYDKFEFYSIEVSDPSEVFIAGMKVHFFPTYLFIEEGKPTALLSGTFSADDLEERIQSYIKEAN